MSYRIIYFWSGRLSWTWTDATGAEIRYVECRILQPFVLRHCACVPVPSRATYGHLSPRWPGVWDDAVLFASGRRSVSNRVWRQRQWANAPCWAHTVASDASVVVSVSTRQCAMCSVCVKWEASCHQTACSVSLWVRWLWNSCYLLFCHCLFLNCAAGC